MMHAALRKITLSVLYVLPFAMLSAQNLVSNGSFESTDHCPQSFSRTASDFKVTGWFSANGGTPDFFHICSTGDARVPANWAGVTEAFDGKGYAGIYGWKNAGNYREYVESALIAPLIKDTTYVLSFRFKLSSYSRYSIDRIGLALSQNRIQRLDASLLSVKPVVEVVLESPITSETGTWQLAEARIKAKGSETYVVIGNFSSDDVIHKYKLLSPQGQQEMLENSAYYYIDDVRIAQVFVPMPAKGTERDKPFILNTTYSFQTVQFDFNSHTLQGEFHDELDRLAAWLIDHPTLALSIGGHTDDVGDDLYNRELSRKRALSVKQYLVSRGVNASRIAITGYGKSVPLVQGFDEAARRTNRRVEFVLTIESKQ